MLVISMAVGTVSPGISCSPGKVPHHPRPPQRASSETPPFALTPSIPRASTSSPTGGPWGWPPHSRGPRSSLLQPSFSRLQDLHPLMGTGQASSTPFKRDPGTGHRIPRGLWRAASMPSSSPAQTLDTNYLYKCCQSIFSKCPSFYVQPGPLSRTRKGLAISTGCLV